MKALSFNKGGNSADSTTVTCIPAGKPGQPGTPRLVASSASMIQLQWDGASSGGLPITGYNLYNQPQSTGSLATPNTWTLIYQGTSLTATHNTGLTAGQSYSYKVQAVNAENQGVFSNIATFTAGSVPQAPTSFTVTQSSRTWCYLTWVKPSLVAATDPPILGYIISSDYGNLPSFSILANITSGNQLSYNLTNQITGLTYKFTIYAYNLIGQGTLSGSISGTFSDPPEQMKPPFYISSVKTSGSQASITVGWNPVNDSGGVALTGYKLYMIDSTTSSGGMIYDGSNVPGVLQYTATTLVLGRMYNFYATALNPKEGTASTYANLYAAALPGKISSITVIANSQTSTCIGLQWAAADSGGSTILLYQLFTSDGTLAYSGSNTQAFVCGLTTGQLYGFYVQATSYVGQGPISDVYSFTIAGIPSVPRYLRSTTATTKLSISLQWEVPLNIGGSQLTGYGVFKKVTGSSSQYSILATIDPSILTYTDTSVITGTSYTYAITAINAVGTSDYSTSVDIIAMSVPGIPAAPTLLAKDRYSIRVSWITPTDNGGSSILGYKLYMSTQSTTNYSMIYSGSNTQYLAAGLASGVTYYFEISANNQAGDSSLSNPSTGILTAESPPAPNNLRVTQRGSGTITITWDMPSDTGGVPLSGYIIERAYRSGNFATVTFAGNTNPGITYFADTGLNVCDTYSYRVSSVNIDQTGLPTSPLTVISSSIPLAPTTAPVVSSITKYAMTVTITALTTAQTGGCPISSYNIYTSINGNSYTLYGTTTTTSILITNLQISAVYQITYAGSNQVYDSGNAFGASLLTSPATTVIAATVPQPPLYLSQGPIQYRDSIYVVWTMPLDTGGLPVTGYILQITDTVANTATFATVSASANSYTATSLIPGKSYSICILAKTLNGNSSWTSNITAIPGMLPITPAGIAIGSNTRSSFTVSWTAITAEDTGGTSSNPITITNYQLSVRNSNTGIQSVYITSSISYALSYLTSAVLYGVKVKACTIVGCSNYSQELTSIVGLVPSMPGAITINNQSSSSISFSWQEPSDDGGSAIIGYQIGIQVNGVETKYQGIYSTSYVYSQSSGIVAGSTYLIRVAAQNTIGVSSWTSQITAYSSDLPSPVSGLTATLVTQTSAQINWVLLTTLPSQGYSTTSLIYILESASCLDNKYTQIYSTTVTSSYSAIGVTPGSCTQYQMKVRNNVGDSAYCSSIQVIFAVVPGTPSIPVIISRNSSTLLGTYITIGWSPPVSNGGVPILGYILEQSIGTTNVWTTIYDGSTRATVLSYTSQGLTAGTTYIFRISARNSVGLSTASSTLSVIAGTMPGKVTNLVVSTSVLNGSNSQITLTWTAGSTGGSAITQYYIQKKVSAASSYDTAVSTGSNALTYTLSNLNVGLNYSMIVAASNTIYDTNNLEGLQLIYSDPVSTLLANAPNQITVFSQVTLTSLNQVNLTWTSPSDGGSPITSYILNKRDSNNVYFVVYQGMNTYYVDSAVISGNSYVYTVLAVNAAGSGTASSPLTANAGTTPGIVTNLVVVSQSQTGITISWSAPTQNGGYAITKYWVMQDNADNVYTPAINNLLVTTYTRTVTNAQIGKVFHFKIAAENTIGIGSYSSEIFAVGSNPPNAPDAINVNNLARTLTSIGLYWSEPAINGGSPILGYVLRRNDGLSGSVFTTVYNSTNSVQSYNYQVTGLIASRSYIFNLVAVNIVGESSTPVTATVVIGTVPSQMSPLTLVSSASTGTIVVSWIAPSNIGGNAITRYRLYISALGSSFGTPTDYTTLTTLQYSFSGIY